MENLKEAVITIKVNSSKEKVWDLLFNRFGEVNVFNPIIEGSHHTSGVAGEVGCERSCTIDSKTKIKEKITARRGDEAFDIDIIEGGLPMMKTAKATFELKSLGTDLTEVKFTMRFNTKPAFMAFFMKGMMKKMLFKMLVGLKYHLETGDSVTKESISKIMKGYKKLDLDRGFKSIVLTHKAA